MEQGGNQPCSRTGIRVHRGESRVRAVEVIPRCNYECYEDLGLADSLLPPRLPQPLP